MKNLPEYSETELIFVEEMSRMQDYISSSPKDDVDLGELFDWMEQTICRVDKIKILRKSEVYSEVYSC